MSNDQKNMWVVRAGRAGEADSLFLKGNCVAVGWVQMGDLSGIVSDREALKARLMEVYPDKKPGAIPNNAGQLYRFGHEMREGDIILYPSKIDRQVHIGRLTGPYRYAPDKDERNPHQRPVEWLKRFPRTKFSQGALYEIGSALSVFQVKTYTDEFIKALEGKPVNGPGGKDPTIQVVAEDIEEITRDFVIKRPSGRASKSSWMNCRTSTTSGSMMTSATARTATSLIPITAAGRAFTGRRRREWEDFRSDTPSMRVVRAGGADKGSKTWPTSGHGTRGLGACGPGKHRGGAEDMGPWSGFAGSQGPPWEPSSGSSGFLFGDEAGDWRPFRSPSRSLGRSGEQCRARPGVREQGHVGLRAGDAG